MPGWDDYLSEIVKSCPIKEEFIDFRKPEESDISSVYFIYVPNLQYYLYFVHSKSKSKWFVGFTSTSLLTLWMPSKYTPFGWAISYNEHNSPRCAIQIADFNDLPQELKDKEYPVPM